MPCMIQQINIVEFLPYRCLIVFMYTCSSIPCMQDLQVHAYILRTYLGTQDGLVSTCVRLKGHMRDCMPPTSLGTSYSTLRSDPPYYHLKKTILASQPCIRDARDASCNCQQELQLTRRPALHTYLHTYMYLLRIPPESDGPRPAGSMFPINLFLVLHPNHPADTYQVGI